MALSIDDQLASLKTHIASVEAEYLRLKAGNKSSSSRVRKSLMDIKKQSHAMRGSITDYVKSLPTKNTRTKKETAVEPEPEPEPEPVIIIKKTRVKKSI